MRGCSEQRYKFTLITFHQGVFFTHGHGIRVSGQRLQPRRSIFFDVQAVPILPQLALCYHLFEPFSDIEAEVPLVLEKGMFSLDPENRIFHSPEYTFFPDESALLERKRLPLVSKTRQILSRTLRQTTEQHLTCRT